MSKAKTVAKPKCGHDACFIEAMKKRVRKADRETYEAEESLRHMTTYVIRAERALRRARDAARRGEPVAHEIEEYANFGWCYSKEEVGA